jgi:hypothetical protein
MSSATDDLLERMREERLIRNNAGPLDPYSKILIFKALRRQFFLVMSLAFVIVVTLIARDFHTTRPWWVIGLPIGGIGLLLSLFPKTETWVYDPWQSRTRRYERHQIER